MQPPATIGLCLLLCIVLHQPLPAASHCVSTASDWWTEFERSCYRWFNTEAAWFPAEAACRSYGGHLASIRSDRENRLVSRLAGCRDAWIGRFATDYHRMADPDSYEWTDAGGDSAAPGSGSGGGYSRQNFTQSDDPHMGAMRVSGLAWLNSHYHELHPYVCEMPATQDTDSGESCPAPFSKFRTGCYWLSDFDASYVEAALHCERELQSHVASVHFPDELSFVGTLELDADTCQMGAVWLGLIKQNPCRPVKEAGQLTPCYQWSDSSGEYTGFPSWAAGHPLLDDWTVNCASLAGEELRSEKCHTKRRFVCKRPHGAAGTR